MTSEKYPSGRTIQTGYDQNGRLASVYEQAGVYAIGFQYQGKGNSLSSYNLGNGTTESFTLNDRMQITSQSLTKGSDVKQKYDYTYGQLDSSNVLKNNGKLAQVESYIGTNKQATKKYAYDELGRLKQEEEYRGDTNALVYRQNFDFDNFGNLYKKSANNSTTGQANPISFTAIESSDINKANNRLASNTTYDDAGNVTQDTKFRNLNYAYDANGRMISSSSTVNSSISNNAVYDAAGQRVAEKVNGSWKYQIYDINSNLVAEYTDATPAGTTNISYTFADSQGSTRATTDKVGAIQSRTDYQAFGEEISAGTGQRTSAQGYNANLGINQKYGQTERDEATGLDHTWFRKHENRAGRWTSPDPYNGSASIGDPQSFNKYSYTQNQPTNFIDPGGLFIINPVPPPPLPEMSWFEFCHLFGFCGNPSSGGSSGGTDVGGDPGVRGERENNTNHEECYEKFMRDLALIGANLKAAQTAQSTALRAEISALYNKLADDRPEISKGGIGSLAAYIVAAIYGGEPGLVAAGVNLQINVGGSAIISSYDFTTGLASITKNYISRDNKLMKNYNAQDRAAGIRYKRCLGDKE